VIALLLSVVAVGSDPIAIFEDRDELDSYAAISVFQDSSKPVAAKPVVAKTVVAASPAPTAKSVVLTKPSFRSRWTINGISPSQVSREYLINHLAGAPHYFDRAILQTLDKSFLEAIHNANHEGTFSASDLKPSTVKVVASSVTTPVVVQTLPTITYRSNCPGGRCPTPSRTYRRR
jgi:hypothetical protein